MTRALAFAFFFLLTSASFSQKIPLINSGEVLQQGSVLYDSGKYDEALAAFMKVPERDTNYVLMLTKAALAQIGAGHYDEALELCAKGLAKPSPYTPEFLRHQAVAEDKKGNFDKAVALFQRAIKQYPADYNLRYNLGALYYNHKDYEKAADAFFQVLSLNPYHTGSHLNLGRMAIGQGRKVHAMFSFGIYLSLANTDNARLVVLNNFVDNAVAEEGSIPGFGNNAAGKLDQIIRAKIAMDKNFKLQVPVDAPVVRQYELLFQQLTSVENTDDDPWMKAYLPIYRFILAQNLIEPFIYHLLSSSSNAVVKKWISKNDKTLKGYYASMNDVIKKQREKVSLPAFGFSQAVSAWYDNSNGLDALGEVSGDVRHGHWLFFHNNSQKSAEGNYTDAGKKQGLWQYYNDDGTLKSVEDYSTGEVIVYYPDGTKREHFYLKDDVIEGNVELFYSCGSVKEKLIYHNGKRDGKGESYFPSGALDMTFQYAGDQREGTFTSYYPDGVVKSVSTYDAGKLNGPYESFHANGKKESEGRYLNGLMVGMWSHYYANGRLERKGSYDDKGDAVGEWLYYDKRGTLTEKRQFDGGHRHGPNTFYNDNKLYYVDTYKKGILIATVYYDRNGKEIANSGSADGTFDAKRYYATGQLRLEGSYRKGAMQGLWKYYNRFGRLLGEHRYEDGQLQGESKEYFPSGETKYILHYKDNDLHGYFQEFYRNGAVRQEGWFQKGNREQQWLTYFRDGTRESDSYYLLDELTGPYYTYALDGKIYSVNTYDKDGLTDMQDYDSKGTMLTTRATHDAVVTFEEHFANKKLSWKSDLLCGNAVNDLSRWYPDGTLYLSYHFEDGKKYGKYVVHHPNGTLRTEGQYVNNRTEGFWKYFYSNGQLSSAGRYLNGSKDSVWTYYLPDGTISSSMTYLNDELDGLARYYSPEGDLLLEKFYADGDFVAFRIINGDGGDAPWQDFSGTGTITVKNAGGTVVFEESYKNGERHGSKKTYFKDGKLQAEYHYNVGDLQGPYTAYYANGKIRERGTFDQDELEGKVEIFRADGTPEEIEHYHLGSRQGEAIYYMKDNRRKELVFWDGRIE